jgi:hypothetical protein
MGGGDTDHGCEELYFAKESHLNEGTIGPIKQAFPFLFLVYFLFATMQFSNQKKNTPRLKKYWGYVCPPYPQVTSIASIGGIFLKIQTSHSPRMRYKPCKFG